MKRLIEYFMPLFRLGLRLDQQIAGGNLRIDADNVQAQARALIEQARGEARAGSKVPPAVESAAFAMVAWIDELMARHEPWQGQASLLQMQLFNTAHAGDEFFEHLANLKAADGEVREVYYHVLLLGFVGQYYFENDDQGELGKIKQLNSRQLPVPPSSLQTLREERITPQPYAMDDPPGPRDPGRWEALRRKAGSIMARLHAREPRHRHREGEREADALAMRAAIHQARQSVERLQGNDGDAAALYRVPWIMFLGDADAHVQNLLQAARAYSPSAAPVEGEIEAGWRFQPLKSMLAIETAAGIVHRPSGHADDGLWPEALEQLAKERQRLPLNGIVVCVGVRSLLGDAAALASIAARLRRLIDEGTDCLRVRLPVYVLATGLELLPGYAAFREALPAEAFAQAVGWRLPEKDVPELDTVTTFEHCFATMAERLHALRLAALATRREAGDRRGVFEFVQAIVELQNALRQFVCELLDGGRSQRNARWRGLYLLGGADPDRPGGAFVADLFEHLLPADQPLARFGPGAVVRR